METTVSYFVLHKNHLNDLSPCMLLSVQHCVKAPQSPMGKEAVWLQMEP